MKIQYELTLERVWTQRMQRPHWLDFAVPRHLGSLQVQVELSGAEERGEGEAIAAVDDGGVN